METRAFDLSVSTYGEVRQHEYEVVILPWGATEPHNLHLPYWTDSILAHDISVAAAKKAYDDDGVLAHDTVIIEKGVKMGRKVGYRLSDKELLAKYPKVVRKLKEGFSIRETAKVCEVSVSTVQKVKSTLK